VKRLLKAVSILLGSAVALALGNAAGLAPEAFLKARETGARVARLSLLRKELKPVRGAPV
jgi:hypothetical protein